MDARFVLSHPRLLLTSHSVTAAERERKKQPLETFASVAAAQGLVKLMGSLIASHLCLQSKGHVSPSRAKAEVSFISRARVVVSVGREEGVVSADRPLPSPVPLRLSFCLSKVGRDHMRKVTKCTKFHSPKESYHVRVSLWIEGNRTTSETFGSSSLYSSWFLSCSYPTFFEKRPSVWTPLPRRLP